MPSREPQRILAISASPRRNGNTDVLLQAAIEGAQAGGADVELVALREKRIAACVECNWCFGAGKCRVQDDFQERLVKIIRFNKVAFTGPSHLLDRLDISQLTDVIEITRKELLNLCIEMSHLLKQVGIDIVSLDRRPSFHQITSTPRVRLLCQEQIDFLILNIQTQPVDVEPCTFQCRRNIRIETRSLTIEPLPDQEETIGIELLMTPPLRR